MKAKRDDDDGRQRDEGDDEGRRDKVINANHGEAQPDNDEASRPR